MTVGELLKEYRVKQNKSQKKSLQLRLLVSLTILKLKRMSTELLLMIYCCS